jgi:tetratricopeptide (TPR) repeat protein
MTLSAGVRLGPYEIVDLLGRGGMGEVYRAIDGRLGREVAIKILSPHLAEDAESLARFRREARAIAALSNPNIVSIFDIGSEGSMPYVVTELLNGETLRDRLVRGRLPLAETMRISSAIAAGLAAAHTKSIIHRDLKPENVFLTSDGAVKILDFGLASTQPPPLAASTDSFVRTDVLTSPGLIMGTIGYASPEQLRGRPLTTASDVFAFGCVLYEMLLGVMPFQRESSMEVIASVLLDDAFTDETSQLLPDDVRELIERCLAKDPSQRLQNGTELAAALRTIDLSGSGRIGSLPPVRPARSSGVPLMRRAMLAGVLLLLVGALALAGSLWWMNRQVIDGGYDLRRGDVSGDSDTKRLTALALRADAAGNRPEAIELLREATRRAPRAPLPAAFLSSFIYYNGNPNDGLRWSAEAHRRIGFSSSPYETLLCRYLAPDTNAVASAALASSMLELRPRAWRLRLSLAHRHLDQREMPAMLAQLMQIDVSAPDDRRLALVLADRASLGDLAGAKRDLQRSRLAERPALLEYARGRMAVSAGHPSEAARHFDTAADRARIENLGSVAIDAGVLAGVSRVDAGDLAAAATSLDVAATKAHRAGSPVSELHADVFGAYVAARRGDRDGMVRRLRSALTLVDRDSGSYDEVRLFMLREAVALPMPPRGFVDEDDAADGVPALVRARESWAHGDATMATALLRQARTEGIDSTWFAEEAALLDHDLGARAPIFHADPPYPNPLRFLAVWELRQPPRALPAGK